MTNIDVSQEKIQKQNPYIDFEKVLQQFNTPQLQCETDNGIATIPLADEISFVASTLCTIIKSTPCDAKDSIVPPIIAEKNINGL